ncbi:arginine biosynthesis protein ArgJ [Polychaeton citri CBS 116435]|uniref:Arginine biosynthesis bifunctional protein ArgJ, mitochondrial n=1 Tax=Polychaeton citri CBS 116435 TaxID=1314669 RepID=A0A9P4Q8C0_9PEZI|nr:arginine biosynthesis protein ArgJ [Polychaeton citri CBS 116435]
MASSTLKSVFRPQTLQQQLRSYSAPAERAIPPAKQKYIPSDGIYPKGFLAGTAHAGVKASNTKYDDVTLIASESPAAAAAVFTRNIFKAAPVQVSKELLLDDSKSRPSGPGSGFRGVVVNSGCANAVTGEGGRKDAMEMSKAADDLLASISNSESSSDVPSTLVMSTGVIGQRLPMSKILSALPKAQSALGNTHTHWLRAASAICTTDTFPKLLSRTFKLPSQPDTTYTIAGTTKGAGMIHPNMGTLLGIICTDASIEPSALRGVLSAAAEKSFNCISIDGDTSTNDTVAVLANGAAAPADSKPISLTPNTQAATTGAPPTEFLRESGSNPDLAAFQTVLNDFMTDLAQLVVRDGEGATKFVAIRVQAHADKGGWITAKRAAASIARSSLVKTALYGKDANWGRILCAIGYAPGIMGAAELEVEGGEAGEQVVPSKTSVSFIPADGSEELKLLVRGEPETVNEERASQILEMEDLEILVRLEDVEGAKPDDIEECVYWTCDLSHEYVTINGDYRT